MTEQSLKNPDLKRAHGVEPISREWLDGLKGSGRPPLNLHFLVMPSYSRHNPAAPLHPMGARNLPIKKDVLAFPLGYAHVIGCLQHYTDHKIELLDPYAEYADMHHLDKWLEHQYEVKNLPSPDYILFGGMSTTWPVIKQATEVIKKMFPSAKLVCGGSIANLHYDLLLTKLNVDIAVIGEGEFTSLDLFSRPDDYADVQGIAYKDSTGKVIKNPPRATHDLDDLPEPGWEFFDTDEYMLNNRIKVGFGGLPIETSKGCPFACRFCYVPGGRTMRYRSPGRVVDFFAKMKDEYAVDFVPFNDDILFVNKDWMWEFGEKLIKADLGLIWTGVSRVNLFSEKDKPLLRMLKDTGLVRLSFGIETGSPKILKNMGKTGVSPDRAKATLRLVRDVGIRATASMLLGFPGESPETIQESIDFCKENLLYPSFYLLQPFPGTDVYDKYVRQDYDEGAYLDLISDFRSGEEFTLNLTTMSDDELVRNHAKAEAEMQSFHFGNYASYYGWRTPQNLIRDTALHLRRKMRGTMFLTP